MQLLYALIAREKTVLAEFTSTEGNFPTVTRVLLHKIPPHNGKMSYVYDKHVFHYIVEDGITYLCMADDPTKRRVPFMFLVDIQKRFLAEFGLHAAMKAQAFSLNRSFGPTLRRQLEFFNRDPSADQIRAVQDQIDQVKNTVVQNIDKVLERGDKIDLLVDKTDMLNQTAFRFERTSVGLKRSMWVRKMKLYLILLGLAAIFLFVVAFVGCDYSFDDCK
mmetsp:Transcript_14640/g.26119  ORF Transcript_14640/g.26119 Transcript_14640/m.26119 type:complete len:219 (+) Transcript_14640:74-730(+)